MCLVNAQNYKHPIENCDTDKEVHNYNIGSLAKNPHSAHAENIKNAKNVGFAIEFKHLEHIDT